MGGGGKGKQNPTVSPYEANYCEIAKQTYEETTPIRQDLLGADGRAFLQADSILQSLHCTDPVLEHEIRARRAYNVARKEHPCETPPAGEGRLTPWPASNPTAAGGIGNSQNALYGNIFNDILSKTYGVASMLRSSRWRIRAGRWILRQSDGAANAAYTGAAGQLDEPPRGWVKDSGRWQGGK